MNRGVFVLRKFLSFAGGDDAREEKMWFRLRSPQNRLHKYNIVICNRRPTPVARNCSFSRALTGRARSHLFLFFDGF